MWSPLIEEEKKHLIYSTTSSQVHCTSFNLNVIFFSKLDREKTYKKAMSRFLLECMQHYMNIFVYLLRCNYVRIFYCYKILFNVKLIYIIEMKLLSKASLFREENTQQRRQFSQNSILFIFSRPRKNKIFSLNSIFIFPSWHTCILLLV